MLNKRQIEGSLVRDSYLGTPTFNAFDISEDGIKVLLNSVDVTEEVSFVTSNGTKAARLVSYKDEVQSIDLSSLSFNIDNSDVVEIQYYQRQDILSAESTAPDLTSALDTLAPVYIEAMSKVYGVVRDQQYAADFKSVSNACDKLHFLVQLRDAAVANGHADAAALNAELVTLGQSIEATVNSLLAAMSGDGSADTGKANLDLACNYSGTLGVTQASTSLALLNNILAIYGREAFHYGQNLFAGFPKLDNGVAKHLHHGLYVPKEDITFDADISNFAIDFSNAKLACTVPQNYAGTHTHGSTAKFKRMIWQQGEGLKEIADDQEYILINDFDTRYSENTTGTGNMMLQHLAHMKTALTYLQGNGQEGSLATNGEFSKAYYLFPNEDTGKIDRYGDPLAPNFKMDDPNGSRYMENGWAIGYGYGYNDATYQTSESKPNALYVFKGSNELVVTEAASGLQWNPVRDSWMVSDVDIFLWDDSGLNGAMYTLKKDGDGDIKTATFRASDEVLNHIYDPTFTPSDQVLSYSFYNAGYNWLNMYDSTGAHVAYDASKSWMVDPFSTMGTTTNRTVLFNLNYSPPHTTHLIQHYTDDIKSECYIIGLDSGDFNSAAIDNRYAFDMKNASAVDPTVSQTYLGTRSAHTDYKYLNYYKLSQYSMVRLLDAKYDGTQFNAVAKYGRPINIPFKNANRNTSLADNGNVMTGYLNTLSNNMGSISSDSFRTYITGLENADGILFVNPDWASNNYYYKQLNHSLTSNTASQRVCFIEAEVDDGFGNLVQEVWMNSQVFISGSNYQYYNHYYALDWQYTKPKYGGYDRIHYFSSRANISGYGVTLEYDLGGHDSTKRFAEDNSEPTIHAYVWDDLRTWNANAPVTYMAKYHNRSLMKNYTGEEWKSYTEAPNYANIFKLDFANLSTEGNALVSNEAIPLPTNGMYHLKGSYIPDGDNYYKHELSGLSTTTGDYLIIRSPIDNWFESGIIPNKDFTGAVYNQGLNYTELSNTFKEAKDLNHYFLESGQTVGYTWYDSTQASLVGNPEVDGLPLVWSFIHLGEDLKAILHTITPYNGTSYNGFTRTDLETITTGLPWQDDTSSINYFMDIAYTYPMDMTLTEIEAEVEYLGKMYDREGSSAFDTYATGPGMIMFEAYDAAATVYDGTNTVTGAYKLLTTLRTGGLPRKNDPRKSLLLSGYSDMKDLYTGYADVVIRDLSSGAVDSTIRKNIRSFHDATMAKINGGALQPVRVTRNVDGLGFFFSTTQGTDIRSEQGGKFPSKVLIYEGQHIASGWEIMDVTGAIGTGKYIWCFELNGLVKRLSYYNSGITHWKDMPNVTLDASIQNSTLKCMYVHEDDISLSGGNLQISAMATGDYMISEYYEISSTSGAGSLSRTNDLLAADRFVDYARTQPLYERGGDLTTLYDSQGNVYTGTAWNMNASGDILGYNFVGGSQTESMSTDSTYGVEYLTDGDMYLGVTNGKYWAKSGDTLTLHEGFTYTSSAVTETWSLNLKDSYGDCGHTLNKIMYSEDGGATFTDVFTNIMTGGVNNWSAGALTTAYPGQITLVSASNNSFQFTATITAPEGAIIYFEVTSDSWANEGSLDVTQANGATTNFTGFTNNSSTNISSGFSLSGSGAIDAANDFSGGAFLEGGSKTDYFKDAAMTNNDIIFDINGTAKVLNFVSNQFDTYTGLGYKANGDIVSFSNGVQGNETYQVSAPFGTKVSNGADLYDQVEDGQQWAYEFDGSSFALFSGLSTDGANETYDFSNGVLQGTYIVHSAYGTRQSDGAALYDQSQDGQDLAYELNGSTFSLYSGLGIEGSNTHIYVNGAVTETYSVEASYGTVFGSGASLYDQSQDGQSLAYGLSGSTFSLYTGFSETGSTMYEWSNGAQVNSYTADAALGTQNYNGTGLLFNDGAGKAQEFDGANFTLYDGHSFTSTTTGRLYAAGVVSESYEEWNDWGFGNEKGYSYDLFKGNADSNVNSNFLLMWMPQSQNGDPANATMYYLNEANNSIDLFEGISWVQGTALYKEVTAGVRGGAKTIEYDFRQLTDFNGFGSNPGIFTSPEGIDLSTDLSAVTFIGVSNEAQALIDFENYTGPLYGQYVSNQFEPHCYVSSGAATYISWNEVQGNYYEAPSVGYKTGDTTGTAYILFKQMADPTVFAAATEAQFDSGSFADFNNEIFYSESDEYLVEYNASGNKANKYTLKTAWTDSNGLMLFLGDHDNLIYGWTDSNKTAIALYSGAATLDGGAATITSGVINMTNSNGDTILLNSSNGQLEDDQGNAYEGELTAATINSLNQLDLNDGSSNNYGLTNFGAYDDSTRFAIVVGGYVLGIGHTSYYAGYGDLENGALTNGTVETAPVGITPDAMDDLANNPNVVMPAHPTGGNWEDETETLAFTASYNAQTQVWTFTAYDGPMILADNTSQQIYVNGILTSEFDVSTMQEITFDMHGDAAYRAKAKVELQYGGVNSTKQLYTVTDTLLGTVNGVYLTENSFYETINPVSDIYVVIEEWNRNDMWSYGSGQTDHWAQMYSPTPDFYTDGNYVDKAYVKLDSNGLPTGDPIFPTRNLVMSDKDEWNNGVTADSDQAITAYGLTHGVLQVYTDIIPQASHPWNNTFWDQRNNQGNHGANIMYMKGEQQGSTPRNTTVYDNNLVVFTGLAMQRFGSTQTTNLVWEGLTANQKNNTEQLGANINIKGFGSKAQGVYPGQYDSNWTQNNTYNSETDCIVIHNISNLISNTTAIGGDDFLRSLNTWWTISNFDNSISSQDVNAYFTNPIKVQFINRPTLFDNVQADFYEIDGDLNTSQSTPFYDAGPLESNVDFGTNGLNCARLLRVAPYIMVLKNAITIENFTIKYDLSDSNLYFGGADSTFDRKVADSMWTLGINTYRQAYIKDLNGRYWIETPFGSLDYDSNNSQGNFHFDDASSHQKFGAVTQDRQVTGTNRWYKNKGLKVNLQRNKPLGQAGQQHHNYFELVNAPGGLVGTSWYSYGFTENSNFVLRDSNGNPLSPINTSPPTGEVNFNGYSGLTKGTWLPGFWSESGGNPQWEDKKVVHIHAEGLIKIGDGTSGYAGSELPGYAVGGLWKFLCDAAGVEDQNSTATQQFIKFQHSNGVDYTAQERADFIDLIINGGDLGGNGIFFMEWDIQPDSHGYGNDTFILRNLPTGTRFVKSFGSTGSRIMLTESDGSENVQNPAEYVAFTAAYFSGVEWTSPNGSHTYPQEMADALGYSSTDYYSFHIDFEVVAANSGGNSYKIRYDQNNYEPILKDVGSWAVPYISNPSEQQYKKFTILLDNGTMSGHEVGISTTINGTHGGGVEETAGVTRTGTPGQAGAKMTIDHDQLPAGRYYFYCKNHSGMGGETYFDVQ